MRRSAATPCLSQLAMQRCCTSGLGQSNRSMPSTISPGASALANAIKKRPSNAPTRRRARRRRQRSGCAADRSRCRRRTARTCRRRSVAPRDVFIDHGEAGLGFQGVHWSFPGCCDVVTPPRKGDGACAQPGRLFAKTEPAHRRDLSGAAVLRLSWRPTPSVYRFREEWLRPAQDRHRCRNDAQRLGLHASVRCTLC